jgi:hypothetical protein
MSLVRELGAVVSTTRALFGAGACSCALVDDSGDVLEFVAAAGRGAEAIVGTTLPVSRGLAGWVVLSGQPIAVADVGADARFARDVAEATEYVPETVLAPRGPPSSRLAELTSTAAELAVLVATAQHASAIVRLAGRGVADPSGVGQLVEELNGGQDATQLAREVVRAVSTFLEGRR